MSGTRARPSPAASGLDNNDLEAKNAGEDACARGKALRGWHERGYLPHCDAPRLYQMVTYRLGDALPIGVVKRLANEPDNDHGNARYRKRLETYLDAGHGACVLRQPQVSGIVIDAWNYFDGLRYDLHAWVVMPNHVHVLIAIRETSLSNIVHGWKSYTARRINKLLGCKGRLWQEDYWDRYIRNENHYATAVEYILNNPNVLPPGARASSPTWYRGVSDAKNAAGDGRAPGNAMPQTNLDDSTYGG